MSFFQPASSRQASTTVSIFGGPGTGKTVTSILLALGVSKHLHHNAPIAMMDPESASPFVAGICEAEGVPLLTRRGRSFVEMREGLRHAEEAGACVYLIDNYSAVFAELVESLKAKLNLQGRRLPYQQREELQRLWSEWVRECAESPIHVFMSGRLSWNWDEDEDESGDTRFVKLGTKMRGESDAGYEPNLLIELEAIHDAAAREKKTRSKRGTITHHAYVLKDRFMVLNGRRFSFKDLNSYQVGDFQRVFDAFRGHFDKLAIGTTPESAVSSRSSAELFQSPQGESAFAERTRRITIAIEELKASLDVLWPGGTDLAKSCRVAAVEALFGTRSMSAVEHLTPDAVEAGVQTLKACEAEIHSEDFPTNRAATIAFVLNVKTERMAALAL